MITQKEAVFQLVMKHTKGSKLTQEAKEKIYEQLEAAFRNGKAPLRLKESNLIKLSEERLLRNYITGLVSNWLRKDERLAGKKSA